MGVQDGYNSSPVLKKLAHWKERDANFLHKMPSMRGTNGRAIIPVEKKIRNTSRTRESHC